MRILSPLLVLLVGCADTPTEPQQKPGPSPDRPADKTLEISAADLKASAENVALVPSPAEMQRALDRAGIATALSAQLADRTMKLDADNKDVVAVRTGVILADALLTVKDAPTPKLVERISQVKLGLTNLGAGGDIAKTLDDLVARIENNAVSRDDLVKELDELHGAIIPEIRFEAGDRCVPLLQAGSWLEGSHLVAGAILAASKPDAASQLLRQPQVVDYFMKYVRTEGSDKAPPDVIRKLENTLTTLGAIASKTSLTLDDVKEVHTSTESVLAML